MKLILKFLIVTLLISNGFSEAKNKLIENEELNNQTIKNVKTFSGPMGMGLRKSYQLGNDKMCAYSTIEGQVIIKLENNQSNCPPIPTK